MEIEIQPPPQSPLTATVEARGEKFEGLAFTFCKAATIILLTQRFALPVASGAAALFYVLAVVNGKGDTRCVLRVPLLIAAFWGAVCAVSTYLTVRSLLAH